MKRFIIKLTIAFLLSSFCGMIVLSYKSNAGYGANKFSHLFGLFLFYISFYQLWITLLYLILFTILYILKLRDKNIFFGIGVVDICVRSYDFFMVRHRHFLTFEDWILFFPAFTLIFVGIVFWIKEKSQ